MGQRLNVFRKLLERLTEQELMAIDAEKAMEVRICSVTHYAFDPSAGHHGKLVLRDFNLVYYPEDIKELTSANGK